ncbi:hypothetical protein ABID55_000297 [Staphylococcus pasteuri]|nr:hypothetical protein [Staphylococcus pasteuri]
MRDFTITEYNPLKDTYAVTRDSLIKSKIAFEILRDERDSYKKAT